jgi:hypothetical protein
MPSYGNLARKIVIRSTQWAKILFVPILALCGQQLRAQNQDTLAHYFVGKEVLVKLDMPGTQQGIDLRFNKDTPMNWKEYSNRLKSSGVAIHKGETARITAFVVKNDRIELQLNGGGFGTFGDDTSTTVAPKVVDKSNYEKQLEQQIANTTDDDRRAQLQRDLDRERARRERQNQDNQAAANVASQIKAQGVADKRLQGGSRFNLRWSGSIPVDQQNPDAVMKLMADYLSFGSPQQQAAAAPAMPNNGGDAAIPATAQLKRGMKIEEVSGLFGPGKQVSESVSSDGLKTQVFEYSSGQRNVDVTYVEGLVVRYTISSN